MKKRMLTGIACAFAATSFSQALFTCGSDEVSKDEFISAYYRNKKQTGSDSQSLKEYLNLYTAFKLKVKAAKDQKLDTLSLLKYDAINFRQRLENDYPVNVERALKQTNFKRNTLVKDDDLFRFADSATLIPGDNKYAIEKKVMFTMGKTAVKVKEWLQFVKDYKLNYSAYKGESSQQLLDSFTNKTVARFYRNHLEEYDSRFKYQLQLFNESNLVYEAMRRNVRDKSASDIDVLKRYYESQPDHFSWKESADVILVNAKYYAYAAYASENMQAGKDWHSLAAASEGMIVADSGRYELTQLPLKPGTKLTEGVITPVIKNDSGDGASFVLIKKIYPAKQQRTFDEAKKLVIAEYQHQLEQNWMHDLVKKYPVKINETVLKNLTGEVTMASSKY